jgi:ATP-binding cassette subfamily B multidrug efflux pump|tara:strand:+ start:127 stop:1158 length:1032 start_codon:yes stop_codon:yes gene_type:complete
MVNHILSTFLILFTGGTVLYLWTNELASVGAVAAAFAMSFRLMGLSHWIMYEMASLFENVGTVRDGIRVLAKTLSVSDKQGAKNLQVQSGDIDFKNVFFSYGSSKNVISDLSLNIHQGERVGLVGPSGGGKTTTMNLLLRFFDLSAGRILIDGVDISQVTQNSLRKNIAMVTQDSALLHRSVRENIKYGNPTASEEQMIRAAEMAEAIEFINDLRDNKGRSGFDAQVGERGVKLSGGQRQRLAIARVILKDAPILLLDEATSALDSEVEAVIQTSLRTVMKGKTVLAIAHRLSTISELDRLIVLKEGKIIEEGSHKQLLLQRGLYSKLWNLQSGGFLPVALPD